MLAAAHAAPSLAALTKAAAKARSTAVRCDGGSAMPVHAREITRRTFTSSTTVGCPKANAQIAAAV